MNKKLKIACLIAVGAYVGCSMLPHHTEFDDKSTLEDVMEMRIPDYQIKRYVADPIIDCHGDFCDKIEIEFNNIPSESFIDSVNKKVKVDKNKVPKRWLRHGEHNYHFQASYGDGERTPKCRKGQHDWFIRLDFSDDSREAVIEYGYW
ncbi:MAG: hypothetical protein IJ841_04640 [Prevotella sp.]|nr:hypothetical protein [Prevotella sp.]